MIDFEKDEHLIFEVRKHWLVFFTEVVFIIILALLPLLISSFVTKAGSITNLVSEQSYSVSLFVFFYALWLLVLWIMGMVFWTGFFLDVWIITSKKVIDVEQHGLFKREISFLHLDKIQDITYEVNGIIPTLLNYGDVSIQTAGIEGEFPIKGVPNPELVQAKLNEALMLYREEMNRVVHELEI